MNHARWGINRTQMIIVLLLASVLVVLAFFQSQPEETLAYDPKDTGSQGLRALVLWLDEMGYPVTDAMPPTGIPASTGLLWIHTSDQSLPAYSAESRARDEADAIYQWVESGGTLVLVGPADFYFALQERFGVIQIETLPGMVTAPRQVQPLLPDVPTDLASLYAPRSLEFELDRAVVPVLAQTSGAPVVALQTIGKGVVWHLTEDFALTNLKLRDARIASLLPAILRTVPAGAQVLFNTPHLATFDAVDDRLGEVTTLQDWLYTTPFGQATLLVMVTILAYLLLQGRRLGPALPGPTANRPREAAEYVSALAGLQRRMRQPQVVAAHHRQRLKHAVGRLAQAPADLPDREWLAQLQRADALTPTMLNKVTELLNGYANVDAKTSDEAELIQLIQATDALLANLPRANKQLVR